MEPKKTRHVVEEAQKKTKVIPQRRKKFRGGVVRTKVKGLEEIRNDEKTAFVTGFLFTTKTDKNDENLKFYRSN